MTIQQESRLSMYHSTIDYLTSKAEITKDLPGFQENFPALRATADEIHSISELQSFDKTGLAKEKAQLQEVLIIMVKENSLKLEAFASLSDNIALAKEVKFTKSKLTKAADTLLKDFAQMVYDKAQANLGNLGAYGITQETQSVLQNAINAYTASLAKPRLGQREKSEATKQLSILFKRAENLIHKIDSAINITISGNPQFHSEYYGVRRVVVTGTGTLILKGAATENNGIPLKGATFTFIPEGGMQKAGNKATEIVKKTADKGNFYIKNMPEGTYKVIVSKIGYNEKSVTVNVREGELATVSVELEKA